MIALAISTLALFIGAEAQSSVLTESQKISALKPTDFAYNPVASNNLIVSAGGSSAPRQLAQWPALEGMGISQTSFVMLPCAMRPPHVHMQASGIMYISNGANVSAGFITEAGQTIVNYISTGASTLFPQGLLHYQQNLGCSPAYYTISYGHEDPGTQVTAPAFNKLPAAVAAAALGLDATTYASVKSSLPMPAFIPNSDPECVARCQGLGINTLAPAPATMPTVSSAGK